MNPHLFCLFVLVLFFLTPFLVGGEKEGIRTAERVDKTAYSADPNHREIAVKALRLARQAGFSDTSIAMEEIERRIESGAYSEDSEPIPGTVGLHFPSPWDQGPQFDFNGWLPVARVPYGPIVDSGRKSGWYRGLPHGFDPVKRFPWPGAPGTTVEWADSPENSFTWSEAIRFYQEGSTAEAYECLGHVLHLLMDMSIPAHVRVVDHGASLKSEKSGTIFEPDIARVIVDEYERALGGGLDLPGLPGVIPNMLDAFQMAIESADTGNLPAYDTWQEYFDSLATYTYYRPATAQYYSPPAASGQFGKCKNSSGQIIEPSQYAISPPGEIGGRWTQMALYGTARLDLPPDPFGPIMPESTMRELCADLVPKAVEFCAGLILHFASEANTVTAVRDIQDLPIEISLLQNFPNPFNPSTTIRYELPEQVLVTLKVFNVLGEQVAVLVEEVQEAGYKEVKFGDGLPGGERRRLPSGMYIYRLTAGSSVQTKKMLLLQ
jgi:hypothetical protein